MFRILVAEDDDNARFLMCEVRGVPGMSRALRGTVWRRWR